MREKAERFEILPEGSLSGEQSENAKMWKFGLTRSESKQGLR